MSDLREFFEVRKKEINSYFEFIGKTGIDSASYKTIKFNTNDSLKMNTELKQILKSNTILMLYNLIEGVVTKSVEEIFSRINDKNIKYSELKSGLKIILLKLPECENLLKSVDLKNINNDLVTKLDQLFEKLFYYDMSTFRDTKKHILEGGGNIDARFIRETLTDKLHVEFNLREEALLSVKQRRNSLAHGESSYTECTKDNSFREIKSWKNKIYFFLDKYVSAIDKYLINTGYKI